MNTSTLLDLLSHTALKSSAVLLAALLLGLALRRTAAARRYALWITAISTLAVLPLAMWALPAWRVLPKATTEMDWPMMEDSMLSDHSAPVLPSANPGVTLPAAKPEAPPPAQPVDPPAFSWNITWQDVVAALPMVWLCIAGLLLLRLGWSAFCLRCLEQHLQPGSCDQVAEIAREIGLRQLPQLWLGAANAVPMVWGVWSPRLLLPQGFETWSREKQRGVLLHELSHLKRRDPLALWTAQWVKALHWFNPLVWLTLRQLRADQERACDDAVLRHGVRPSDYAQSLLDLSRHTRLAPGLSLCALTITRCAPVEARVKAILDPTRRREGLTLRWLATLAGGALLITLPVAMLHAIEGPTLRGRILDRNGVVLAESTKEKVRIYPLKTLAAHMIGYLRPPDEKHAQFFGAHALEKQHDTELTAGKEVTLTLDMRIQSLAYRAMNEAGVTRGAAVVLDPRTGEILAAVSLPSYDPNLFVPSITQENWESYMSNRDIPLQNRCLRGFVPGSTYKLLTGLAGGAAGISGQKFNCTGSVTYGNKTMQCWKQRQDGGGHGVLGMSDALAMSCSCFWHQYGNAAGIGQIESMGSKIGFGSVYGIADDESPGILPTPAWLKEHRPQEKWSEGYTANTSIGQGLVLATPLQMAVLAATVGNTGRVPQPAIVKPSGASSWRVDLTKGTLTAADVEPLREGMRLVVNSDSGTGKPARSDKVIIAGKTGTAQNWRRDADGTKQDDNHGWFIGFAPYDHPQLAFAIIKTGAKSGGGDCGPIAKRIVEETLALPADGSGEVKPVSDEVGRAHEKQQQAQARFDAKAEVLKAAIEGIKPDATTGFKLEEITVRSGQVVVRGVASSMTQALQFREALLSLKWEDELEWVSPVPHTLPDGKRVGFGVLGVLASNVKNATALEVVQASLASLNDPRSKIWQALRQIAGLAEIPGGRTALRGELGDTGVHFYLPRQEVAGWLRDSLGDDVDIQWLEAEDAQSHNYPAKNGYQVEVSLSKSSGNVLKVTVKPQARSAFQAAPKPPQIIKKTTAKVLVQSSSASSNILVIDKGSLDGIVADSPVTTAAGLVGKTATPEPHTTKVILLTDELCRVSAKVEGTLEQGILAGDHEPQAVRPQLHLRFLSRNAKINLGSNVYSTGEGGVFPADLLLGRVKQFTSGDVSGEAMVEPAVDFSSLDEVIVMEAKTELPHQEAATPPAPADQAQLRQQTNVEIPMKPELAKQWTALKKAGLLADLPAGVSIFDLGLDFHFSARREAGHRWLLASVFRSKNVDEASLQWPEPPEPFNRTYAAAGHCTITVHSPDGKHLHIIVSQRRPSILIAPDESQEPRPAGKLAPEYPGKSLTHDEAMPGLDVALQTLRPTISPLEVRLPAFRPQPVQLSWQAPAPPSVPTLEKPFPLNRLQGDLSPESVKALQRSLRSGTRMQQALVVRAPLK